MFRKRTPGQAPTGPSWLSGDEMPAAQSQRAERLRKSSEINGAWQIGSDEKERQDGGLSELIMNNDDPPCQSQRKESRKRIAEDSEIDSRMILAWIHHTSSDSDQEETEIKKKNRTKCFKLQLRLTDEVCSESEYALSML